MSDPKLTRRNVLKGISTAAAVAGARAYTAKAVAAEERDGESREPTKRPNILFFLGEGLRYDAFSAAGNPLVQTPVMDRIAREGVTFKNSFTTNALCLPSRGSILTGAGSHTTGAVRGSQPLRGGRICAYRQENAGASRAIAARVPGSLRLSPGHRGCTMNPAGRVGAVIAMACAVFAVTPVHGQSFANGEVRTFPWSNARLLPDERADMVMQRMTLAEKLQLIHGAGFRGKPGTEAVLGRSNGGAGLVPGIPRLGLPDLNMSDSAVGVANTAGTGRYSTALPSALALASSWDQRLAYQYGSLIGAELVAQGFNVSLGGGVNLARDPRDGRIFEFLGEDPILAGNMVARVIEGIQAHHVIGDVKHFAVNDQESGRMFENSVIGVRALRETDLLPFEIAIREAHPGMVMCSYNLVNGVYSCQNEYLLENVLKKEWGFDGWVISDWWATHSTVPAILAGLDMEQPDGRFFGTPLLQAVQGGQVPVGRLDDAVHRILRTEFALGAVDHPPQRKVPDIFKGFEVAQQVEEKSAVLLKNDGVLPLNAAAVRSIAVIGSHADVAVLSGGGSAQVSAPDDNAVLQKMPPPGDLIARLQVPVWDPSAPLRAIRDHAPKVRVVFDSGADPAGAAATARAAQVAIVFVHQHLMEGSDAPNLDPPGNQNALVAAVAAVNPNTIVVLETGGPVTMPWAHAVAGILEAWYPGIRGGEAIANLLFGTVNPSGKLAVTFPRSESQLPRTRTGTPPGSVPTNFGPEWRKPFDVRYDEGIAVGYKWFDEKREKPLYPFGYGLSYSRFVYSAPSASVKGGALEVGFTVGNTSRRSGSEIAEVYLTFPRGAGEPPKRLIGWVRVDLAAGQSRRVLLQVQPLYLSTFDTRLNRWREYPGRYTVLVGPSSATLPLNLALYLH